MDEVQSDLFSIISKNIREISETKQRMDGIRKRVEDIIFDLEQEKQGLLNLRDNHAETLREYYGANREAKKKLDAFMKERGISCIFDAFTSFVLEANHD